MIADKIMDRYKEDDVVPNDIHALVEENLKLRLAVGRIAHLGQDGLPTLSGLSMASIALRVLDSVGRSDDLA